MQANLWKLGWVFLYRSFISFHCSLSATMDPNLLRECTQCLLETADFIRNRTAAVTSTMQTTTTTTSSSTTVQAQPNSTTVRSEHNQLFGYRPPAPSRAPQNRGTRCSPYTNVAIACASSTWSRSFVCMVTARQQTPLSTSDRIDLSLNGLGGGGGEEVIIPQRRKHGRGAQNHTCGLSIPNKWFNNLFE